ncbi:hypothetical protein M3Y96_00797400 [Aphelenchoides besseyi]|nr:hypothetical protein M3Y96_00797400 [Aphelenchoides besseyi]
MFEDEDEEDILPERRRVLALQNLDSQRQSIRMIEELLSKCVRSLGTRTTMSKKSKMKASVEVRRRSEIVQGEKKFNECFRICVQVGNPDGWTPSFLIWNKQNHCKCNFFKSQVMDMNTTYLVGFSLKTKFAVNIVVHRQGRTMEDDLKQKREQVMASLTSIRVGKTKLLKMLANLKEMEDRGESVIVSLVNSFDSLSRQEEEYIQVIRNIIQQGVVNYAQENKKKEESQQSDSVKKFIEEVDEIERNAIAASEKHDNLLSTMQQRLEKKRLLDQIHKLESEKKMEESGLPEQAELAQLQRQLVSEKLSVDRAQEVRNRLRQEAFKRGYLQANGTPTDSKPEPQMNSFDRVPPLMKQDESSTEPSTASQSEVHEKIQRHIDQIKNRRQRIRECYAQAQEMMKLNETYTNAKKRASDLEKIQQKLQETALDDHKTITEPADDKSIE